MYSFCLHEQINDSQALLDNFVAPAALGCTEATFFQKLQYMNVFLLNTLLYSLMHVWPCRQPWLSSFHSFSTDVIYTLMRFGCLLGNLLHENDVSVNNKPDRCMNAVCVFTFTAFIIALGKSLSLYSNHI